MQTPAPTDYVRATSVSHAISLLEEHGEESRILAGGHSLLPMMKLRIARPEMLIDINELDELRGIRVDGDELVLGAMVTHREVLESPVLFEHYAIFRECEKVIADPLVRNRGTVGGSMCQADPSEDLSAVGSALRGSVVIQGASGTRTVPLREFHEGPYETQVEPAEIMTEVRFPIRPGAGSPTRKWSGESVTGRSVRPVSMSLFLTDSSPTVESDSPPSALSISVHLLPRRS